MSKQHTPGPWFPYKRPEPIGYAEYEIHYGTAGECVAEVVHGEGNAKLLAAAPDLKAALTACLKRLVADCADKSCVEIMEARAALTAAGVA